MASEQFILQIRWAVHGLPSLVGPFGSREAWEQADAEGAAGDRVRRGMAAAIEAVS